MHLHLWMCRRYSNQIQFVFIHKSYGTWFTSRIFHCIRSHKTVNWINYIRSQRFYYKKKATFYYCLFDSISLVNANSRWNPVLHTIATVITVAINSILINTFSLRNFTLISNQIDSLSIIAEKSHEIAVNRLQHEMNRIYSLHICLHLIS